MAAAGTTASAQAKKSNTSTAPAAAPAVSPTAVFSSFETSLASGSLSFIRVQAKSDGEGLITYYTLSKTGDASFNNRKPVRIGLSRQSFDSVFTKTSAEMAGKWNKLNKYVTDHNISLATEKGWIAIVDYYNSF